MHLASLLLQSSSDNAAAGLMALGFGIIFFSCLIGILIVIIPFWFICKKAGFSPWLALLNLIPFGTLILLYVLAFAEWSSPKPPVVTPLS